MHSSEQRTPPRIPTRIRWTPAEHQFTECCICISRLYQKQAIFIAPCAHTFHYRCIAPLLRSKGFSCPMCRQESNLQESLFDLDSEDFSETEDELVHVSDRHDSEESPLSRDTTDERFGFPSQSQRASNISAATNLDGVSSQPGSFANYSPNQQPLPPSMLERVTEGTEMSQTSGGMWMLMDNLYSRFR